MPRTLLPRVLERVDDGGDFTPGATEKRGFAVKTVPEHFVKQGTAGAPGTPLATMGRRLRPPPSPCAP